MLTSLAGKVYEVLIARTFAWMQSWWTRPQAGAYYEETETVTTTTTRRVRRSGSQPRKRGTRRGSMKDESTLPPASTNDRK